MKKIIAALSICFSTLALAGEAQPFRNFYLDLMPIVGPNLFASDPSDTMLSRASLGFNFIEHGDWSGGLAFVRNLRTEQYSSITYQGGNVIQSETGENRAYGHNIGIRAFWKPDSAMGVYISPALYYRWVRVQFENSTTGQVDRASSNAGLLSQIFAGYQSQIDGPVSWRAGLGYEYEWNQKSLLSSSAAMGRTMNLDHQFNLIAEFALVFLF